MMIAIITEKIYPIVTRIFLILLFGLTLYLSVSLILDEGYQEHYYTSLNIGFTFRDYILKYPTELAFPLALIMALAGLIFRWKIGWIAGFAIVVGITIRFIVSKDWDIGVVYALVFLICLIIMFLQLRSHFEIKPKHMLWSAALILAYGALLMIEDHGGFLTKPLPAY